MPSTTRDVLSLVELVYDNTRRAILDGRFKPGQRLRLQDIAAENKASFIPVREALRLLEAGRLVEIIPNKGARVADVSEADMLDAYSIRINLERLAIERACEKITDAELEQASKMFEDMMAAFESADVEKSSEAHREFHLTLYRAARSPWLIHLIQLLMSNTDRYRRLLTPARPSPLHLAAIRSQHLAILEAVKARDAARAGEELRHHLEDTQARYKAGLSERI
jgi:DNA-binding GntR family transcriptional regulator